MKKQHLDILIESEVKQKKLTKNQINWLNKCVEGTWEYKDGVINTKGDVMVIAQEDLIPVQFGKIIGNFFFNHNTITSLKGCPHTITKKFECWKNKLTSLEYAPTKVETFFCSNNPFILNDKLFEDIKRIGGKWKIENYDEFMEELKSYIIPQFGITDKKVINKIWQSYMNILEGKK